MHCCTQCPEPAAGHHQPTPLLETPGHSQASLCQSLVGSLLLYPGSLCTQGSVCALLESATTVLCKFWWLYSGVNGHLLQEGLCHTQVSCTQSPYPCGRPLLIHIFMGDTQTQLWLSLCGVCGSWCTQGLFESSECLWWVRGLILNAISPLLLSSWGFSFAFGHGYHFLVGSNISPVDSCSAVSFGVLTGEDECRNFYLAILCHIDLLLHLPVVTGKFGHGVQNEAG